MRTVSLLASSSALVLSLAAGCVDSTPSDGVAAQASALGEAPSPGENNHRKVYPADARITVSGDDCPIELQAVPSPDFEAVTMTSSENWLTPERPTVRCRIGIDYSFPAGWKLFRPSAVVRGFQHLLDTKQSAAWVVRTRLDGGPWGSAFELIKGPTSEDFRIIADGGEDQGEDSTACGATSAHIDVEILASSFARGPLGSSDVPFGTLDSIDTEIDWDTCD